MGAAETPCMRFAVAYPQLNNGCTFPPAKVKTKAVGLSALEFLTQSFAGSGTEEQWRHRLVNGQVKLQTGEAVTPDNVLRDGDALCYTRSPWQEPDAPNHFDLLYEDEHVLAVCKPAGLQVLAQGVFGQRTLIWLLQQYHQQHRSSKYPDSLAPVPVHRLGRGTSGVLLCACTEAARRQLSKDFETATDMGAAAVTGQQGRTRRRRRRRAAPPPGGAAQQRPLGKVYRALVTGLLDQDEGEVRVPIGLIQYPGLPSGLFAASASGLPSLSSYRVLARHPDTTLVEVTILTGRPHQIRIHMAALGHPLVGDPLYGPGGVPQVACLPNNQPEGGSTSDCVMPGDCGYHLHSMQLEFRHPVTGDVVTIQAPIPEALQLPQEGGAPLLPDTKAAVGHS